MTAPRRLLEIALVAHVVAMIGLAIAAQVAPATGHALLAVRSRSMAPFLDVGDLVVAKRVGPELIREGDVISFSLASGTTVTHRVAAIGTGDDGPVFTTRGDANSAHDPVAVRPEQLRGRLVASVPALGFLLAMLSMPSGIVALLAVAAALLTAIWLLDDDANEDEELALLLRELELEAAGPTRTSPATSATP